MGSGASLFNILLAELEFEDVNQAEGGHHGHTVFSRLPFGRSLHGVPRHCGTANPALFYPRVSPFLFAVVTSTGDSFLVQRGWRSTLRTI